MKLKLISAKKWKSYSDEQKQKYAMDFVKTDITKDVMIGTISIVISFIFMLISANYYLRTDLLNWYSIIPVIVALLWFAIARITAVKRQYMIKECKKLQEEINENS